MPKKVLIVEDEQSISSFISMILTANGYDTIIVNTGEEALTMISSHCPDLVILDLGLPDMDGMQILKAVRQWSKVPIVVVSARSHERDKVAALDAGADDYLPKPFAPDELICRVRAMLRRGGEYRPTVLTFGDAALDCSTGMLSCAGRSVRLSGREFQVMELFLRAPKVVLSAERILERVWGWDSDAEINVVWVHISNLRKKLKGIGSCVTIRANRGLGYVLESSHD